MIGIEWEIGMVDYPNKDQLDALDEYAEKMGKDWKDKLLTDWARGTDDRALGGHEGRGYLLRQVRNQFGPTWLALYIRPEEDTTSCK